MDARETINIIRDAAQYAQKHGLEIVRICDLENLLNEIEKQSNSEENKTISEQTPESALALWKAQHEASLAHYKASIDTFLEKFRAVIRAGQSALKSAILINGGAAVALLAFLGRIWDTQPSMIGVSGLPCSLLAFVFGVLSAAVASGTTYLSQYLDALNWIKTAFTINLLTILIVIVSYCLFGYGSYKAYMVFAIHLQPR